MSTLKLFIWPFRDTAFLIGIIFFSFSFIFSTATSAEEEWKEVSVKLDLIYSNQRDNYAGKFMSDSYIAVFNSGQSNGSGIWMLLKFKKRNGNDAVVKFYINYPGGEGGQKPFFNELERLSAHDLTLTIQYTNRVVNTDDLISTQDKKRTIPPYGCQWSREKEEFLECNYYERRTSGYSF